MNTRWCVYAIRAGVEEKKEFMCGVVVGEEKNNVKMAVLLNVITNAFFFFLFNVRAVYMARD